MSKRSRILHLALLGLALAPGCTGDAATDLGGTERITGAGARVLRATAGALTAPSTAAPAIIATDFVSRRAALGDDQLVVAAQVLGRGGVTHVRLSQTIDGLRVEGAYARVAISSQGEVLQSIDRLAPASGAMVAATISERDALVAALARLGYDVPALVAGRAIGHTREFVAGAAFLRNPSVERVAYLAADGSLRIGFQVETWSQVGNRLDYTLVDGAGAIVAVEHRTNTDRYNVFVEDPLKGPQAIVAGPGAGNAESPSGWLAGSQTTINITGNNARAYLDTDANNAPDSGGSAVATGEFLTAVDLGAQPSTTGNKAVAVQNLFYLNNVMHDVLHRYGFNEAAGNFQVNNFSLGGLGNDPVQAEAQDGSGTDNANFSTPNDGSAPRMQMFLWSGSGPNAFVTVSGVNYGAYNSSFGPALTLTGVTGPLGLMTPADGCTAATASLTGKVAVVDRGTCNFTDKVYNAQRAGAVAVIISNNVPGNAFAPGGTNRKVRIPSAMVTQADGATLKGLAGTSSQLRKNPSPPLSIDGDLDADIVFHEYGHGLTWRMIGSMSGKLAGAVGEGASDVNAFLIDGDDRIGEYSFSNPIGIRRYPYASHPLTYSAVDGGGVHNDGEIYARAMWRVMENYLAVGLTAADLHADFVDGMNFTPASPAFEDMRDGMLQSVAGTTRACLIWRGFAASGIGVGADGQVSASGTVTIVESFAVPATCQ